MIAFAYYLLKVIICSGILYGYYLLTLRNKAFNYWNRFYLICTVMLSVLVPLVRIDVGNTGESATVTAIPLVKVMNSSDAYVESIYVPEENHVGYAEWFASGYFIVSLGLLFAFLFTLLQIRNMIRRYEIIPMDGMAFLNTAEKGTPFSFLKYIFWNREIPADSVSGKQILLHEIAHVRQKHSYDKLFIQCVLVIFWSNPFFWLIRKEIGMIHEFIADREAVKDQDSAAFAAMILQAAFPNQPFAVGSYFFHSPIKRRLKMLINSNKPGRSYFNRIMVLPILVIIGAGFTIKVSEKSTSQLDRVYTVVIDPGHGGTDGGAISDGIYEKDLNLAIAKKIKSLNTDQKVNLVLVRESDATQPVKERAPIVAAANPDLLISIHVNSSEKSTQNGLEVFISGTNRDLEKQNIALASAIQQEMKPIMNTALEVRRRFGQNIYMLDSIARGYPAAMVEFGYITNEKDRAFLQSPENIEKIAGGILAAIKKFLNQNGQTAAYSPVDAGSTASTNITLSEVQRLKLGYPDTISLSADSIVYYQQTDKNSLVTDSALSMVYYLRPKNKMDSSKSNTVLQLNARDQLTLVLDTVPGHVKSVDFTEKGEVIVIFDNGKAEKMSASEAQKKGYVPLAILEKRRDSGVLTPGVRIRGIDASPQPLIILNGVTLRKGTTIKDLDNLLEPENIESLEVLKDSNAEKEYGEEGKDGVLIIKTKNKTGTSNKVLELAPAKETRLTLQEPDKVFVKVEVDPMFSGGAKAMNRYIMEKLDTDDTNTKRAYAGSAAIRFIVDREGNLSELTNVSGENGNAKLANALIDVLKSGPKWLAAVQNGKKVNAYYTLQFKYPPMLELK